MTDPLDSVLQETRAWFKENAKRFAFKKLEREIIKTQICVECGTCVSVCPVHAISGEWIDDRFVPTLTGECVSCGLCYAFCPRTFSLRGDLLGEVQGIYRVRTVHGETRGQNGGAVTSLLQYLLGEHLIDAAVIAQSGEKTWRPHPAVITDPDQIYGGTFYVHVPVVEGLMEAIAKGHRMIAIVGTSCDIDAVEKLTHAPEGVLTRSSDLEILRMGLFCMDSFDYSRLGSFLQENGIDIEGVKKFEIAKGKFRVLTDGNTSEWQIAELEYLMNKSCHYCYDLTCEKADISFGNIGSDDEWTTVIVRSERGRQLFEQLKSSGRIEVEELEQKAVFVIEMIARMKMKRKYSNRS